MAQYEFGPMAMPPGYDPVPLLECAAVIKSLRAELAARAVPGEDVAKALGVSINRASNIQLCLRAAGFTVIRTEAHDER